jgi:hypothetical protein
LKCVSPAGQEENQKAKGKRQKAKMKKGLLLFFTFAFDFCLLPFAFLTSAKAWESANSSVYQDKLVIVY